MPVRETFFETVKRNSVFKPENSSGKFLTNSKDTLLHFKTNYANQESS